MTTEKVLRNLTAEQRKQVDRTFKCLATVAAKREAGPVILDRNKYVDSTILDLLDEVNGDEFLLVLAFAYWVWMHDLTYVLWPVTQFQTALVGAVAAAEKEVAAKAEYDTHVGKPPHWNPSDEWDEAVSAFSKFGGAA